MRLNSKLTDVINKENRLINISQMLPSYNLWIDNISLHNLENSRYQFKINNSFLSKRDRITKYKKYIKLINQYIENHKQIPETNNYYGLYLEANQHLNYILSILQKDIDILLDTPTKTSTLSEDFKEIEIPEDKSLLLNNYFIQTEQIILVEKDKKTYMNFTNLSFTDLVFIMYFIYEMECLKNNNEKNHIENSKSAKTYHFNSEKELRKFIHNYCLASNEEFNYKSMLEFWKRIKASYTEIKNNKDKSGYKYTNIIRYGTDRQFRSLNGGNKYYFKDNFNNYLQTDNLIKLLKLINYIYKIV